MKRILSPSTNPAGLTSLIAALYALGYGAWNVAHHRGAVDPQVIVAALAAVAALFTRQVVTPVSDPHDGAGRALVPSERPAMLTVPGLTTPELAADVVKAIAASERRRKPPSQPSPAPDAAGTVS
jgi:hypothetical protein